MDPDPSVVKLKLFILVKLPGIDKDPPPPPPSLPPQTKLYLRQPVSLVGKIFESMQDIGYMCVFS